MGIQKFDTFEEARRALWLKPGDPEILATLDDHQREYDLFRAHCDAYGYVFYVMRKPAPQ